MRLVVVTTSFPRHAGDPAGHFVETEARLHPAAGTEIHVLAAGSRPGTEQRGYGSVEWLGGERLFGWPGALARARRAPWRAPMAMALVAARLRLALERLGPIDELHSHWLVPTTWPLLPPIDAPQLAHAHGADVRLLTALPAPVRANLVATLLERTAVIRFAAASSQDRLLRSVPPVLAARLARQSEVRPPPIEVPMSLAEPAARKATRASLGVDTGMPLAVVACRLVASKRVALAIAAARLAAPLELLVIGDGPERGPLAQLARRLAVRARFVGLLPRPDALGAIAAADVLLHPSASEAAPTVVREARLLGTPVVGCDAGDVSLWAQGDRGIRCASAEPGALAAAMLAAVEAGRVEAPRSG